MILLLIWAPWLYPPSNKETAHHLDLTKKACHINWTRNVFINKIDGFKVKAWNSKGSAWFVLRIIHNIVLPFFLPTTSVRARRRGKAPRKIEETSSSKNRAKHTATNLSRTWRWSIMMDMRCLPSSIIGQRFENPQASWLLLWLSNPQAPWLLLYAQSAGSMPTVLLSICRLHARCSALNLQAMTAAMLSFFLSFSPVYLRNPHNNTLRQAR